MADQYERVTVFFLGVFLGAFCALLYTMTESLSKLFLIELLNITAYALHRPSLLTLIAEHTKLKTRSLELGIFDCVYDIAEALASVASALIVSKFGFETIFYMSSFCQASSGIIALKMTK